MGITSTDCYFPMFSKILDVASEPRKVEVIAVTMSSCTLSWDAPTSTNVPVDGYHIQKKFPADAVFTRVRGIHKTSPATVEGLEKKSPYQLRVVAVTRTGEGPPSQPVMIKERSGNVSCLTYS